MSPQPSTTASHANLRQSHLPSGVHYTLELYDGPAEFLNDATFIEEALREAAERANCQLLQIAKHQFTPHGVTAVALLAESHLSIHTWPEHGYAAIDLFTCGSNVTPQAACEFLVQRFEAKSHEINILRRNTKPTSPGAPSR